MCHLTQTIIIFTNVLKLIQYFIVTFNCQQLTLFRLKKETLFLKIDSLTFGLT